MGRLPLQQASNAFPARSPATQPSPSILPALPPAPTKRPFTARQQAFIDNYVVSKNATDAARKAGYAPKDADVQGPTLLRNLRIRAEIDRRLAAQAEKLEVTAERVQAEIVKIAFANMKNYMRPGLDGAPVLDFSDLTDDQGAALGSVTVEEFKDGRSDKREVRRTKFQMWDKPKALEMLAKRFGMLVERHDHKHEHQHTVLGRILLEIDAESRSPVVEHKEDEAA